MFDGRIWEMIACNDSQLQPHTLYGLIKQVIKQDIAFVVGYCRSVASIGNFMNSSPKAGNCQFA